MVWAATREEEGNVIMEGQRGGQESIPISKFLTKIFNKNTIKPVTYFSL